MTTSTYKPKTAYLPGDSRSVNTSRLLKPAHTGRNNQGAFVKGGKQRRNQRKGGSRSYDVAFSVGGTDVRAPLLTLPHLGSRWISGGLTLLLAFMLYALSTASTFKVSAAEVSGNIRLPTEEVTAKLGVAGEQIFKAIPAEIENRLHIAFPDLEKVTVRLGFPNKVIVDVVERQPVLAWYKDNGDVTWIDANGVAFTPRGDVPGLIQVSAKGEPPKLPVDETRSSYNQVFLEPEMVNAFKALAPSVPAGITMTYDPLYGAGWQDPRGWSVYFGQNIQEITMKLKVYQSIVDTFTRQGIQPTLISVAYLDAPFYK